MAPALTLHDMNTIRKGLVLLEKENLDRVNRYPRPTNYDEVRAYAEREMRTIEVVQSKVDHLMADMAEAYVEDYHAHQEDGTREVEDPEREGDLAVEGEGSEEASGDQGESGTAEEVTGPVYVAAGGRIMRDTRPPLGPVPGFIWREQRVKHLAQALLRAIGTRATPNYPSMIDWTDEMLGHLQWLERRKR